MRAPLLLAVLLLAACGAEREVPLPGERLALRDGRAEAVAPARGIALPAAQANVDWTHRGGGPDHALTHPALPGALSLAFSVAVGEGDSRRARITAEPVVAASRIFTLDARATVAAVSTAGALLWTREVVPAADARADASGGGLATDGATLYVSTGFGRVTALDAATGEARWTQDLDAPGSSAPTVQGGSVYIVSRDSRAWAIDAATGDVRWELGGVPSTATSSGGAGVAARDGLVVLPFPSGEVVGAFPEGGLRRWSSIVAGGRLGSAAAYAATDIGGDPVLSGATAYVGNVSGRLAALGAEDGSTLWSVAEGAASPVVPVADSVFFVNDIGDLLRLDAATGATIWRAALPQAERSRGVTAHYGPVLAGGRLLVASSDGLLRQFDPASGASLGDVALPAGAASSPVVAGATLYVLTEDGRLNAFR